MAVVDSSALLRLLLEGEAREEAWALLEEFAEVVVPLPVALWVADALASMGLPHWAAAEAVALYYTMPRVRVSGGPRGLEESALTGLPPHEAAALLEARELGAVLVTYNPRMRRAAAAAGVRVRPVSTPTPLGPATAPPINPRAAAPA